jgi:hypothetical protein
MARTKSKSRQKPKEKVSLAAQRKAKIKHYSMNKSKILAKSRAQHFKANIKQELSVRGGRAFEDQARLTEEDMLRRKLNTRFTFAMDQFLKKAHSLLTSRDIYQIRFHFGSLFPLNNVNKFFDTGTIYNSRSLGRFPNAL